MFAKRNPLASAMESRNQVQRQGSALSADGKDSKSQPKSLGAALREAGISLDGPPSSETASEEDYDDMVKRDKEYKNTKAQARNVAFTLLSDTPPSERPSLIRTDSGVHIYPEDEESIQLFLKRSLERAKDPGHTDSKKAKFRDLVFSRQFSTFDRQNALASSSPFHGFYTLFWMATALFVFKISAENWRTYGTPLGSSEILNVMFSKDVLVLLVSDGVLCAATGVSWALQKLTHHGYVDWDKFGWIVQNIWQVIFMTSVVGWTLVRDWPWTHTVFFVLHGIVMLMKQHSYAFYNGHLSSVFKRRRYVLAKLKDLEGVDPTSDTATTSSSAAPPVSTISTNHLKSRPSAATRRNSLAHIRSTELSDIDRIAQAVANREPLDDEQIHVFERIIKWEIDALSDELKGAASDASKAYPANLTFVDHYKWIPLPTLVYELEYPRSDKIDWSYVAEKLVAMVGVLFVMVQVSQHSIYPVVMKTVTMKEANMPLIERIAEFPWMLSDLIFPFMMEYLLVWYLIWETILNILAELTFFADRSFYDAWWNSVSWDQFARDWNRPVHIFLLRHVYHSSISSMKVNKHTATLITFFLSACIHELVMWCLFKKLRGYLLLLQMSQLPLVRLSRTEWLKNQKTLGNLIFWLGIFTGPSLLCSLYLIL